MKKLLLILFIVPLFGSFSFGSTEHNHSLNILLTIEEPDFRGIWKKENGLGHFTIWINKYGEYQVIYLDGNNLSFTLFNKSDYAQMYNYSLEDLNESNSNIFENIEGQYLIMPNDSLDLSFIADFEASSQADIKLIVWPSEHEYSMEEYYLTICPCFYNHWFLNFYLKL